MQKTSLDAARAATGAARRASLVASAFLLGGLAGPAVSETLAEAVSSALTSNPEALSLYAGRRTVEQELVQARAGLLPSVDVRLAAGREQTDDPASRRAFGGDITLSRREAGATVRQLLFDGNQVRGDIATQQARVESSRARILELGETLGLRTTDAYMDVLRAQELERLARDNVDVHRATLDKTETRFKSGVGQKADMQQAEGRLALAVSTLIGRQGAVRDASYRYQRLVGSAPRNLLRPGSPAGMPASLEQAQEWALANSPTVQVAEREVSAAQAAAQASRGRLGPRLDAELNIGNNRDIDGVPGKNRDASLMLVARYAAYRGGADQARVRELEERLTAARENLANARRAVQEEVARAWVALTTARDALKSQEAHVVASNEVLSSYRAQYDLGRRTLLDVLNAENELFQARSTLANGQYAAMQNEYRVVAATGGLARALELTDLVAKK